MKKLSILFLILAICGSVFAQVPTTSLTKKEQKKLLKEERDKQRAIDAARTAEMVGIMTASGRFVLEGDMLFDRYGNSFQVQSNINFIASDSTHGVIQIGNSMYIGTNGLGGVTITGPLDNYEVDKNEKRGTYHISFTVRSTMGPYDVDMNVSSGGQADATVRGAFRGSIRYSGYLVHPSETRIFQGQSRF